MQRAVFEKFDVEGLSPFKVDTIAISSTGLVYLGSNEGNIILHDCKNDYGALKYNAKVLETLPKPTRDRGFVTNITCIETWHVVFVVLDGVLTVYDSATNALVCQLSESRGCTAYSYVEKASQVIVANKRKISVYVWQGASFSALKEIQLKDTPMMLLCVPNRGVIAGYNSSHYEYIDTFTSSIVRIRDIEGDGRAICIELSTNILRAPSVLFSMGKSGVAIEVEYLKPTAPSHIQRGSAAPSLVNPLLTNVVRAKDIGLSTPAGQYIQWSLPPLSVHCMTPFVLSLLADSVEIHDEASLVISQNIKLVAPSMLRLQLTVPAPPARPISSSTTARRYLTQGTGVLGAGLSGGAKADFALLYVNDKPMVLKVTPLATQVLELVYAGAFEQALILCAVCGKTALGAAGNAGSGNLLNSSSLQASKQLQTFPPSSSFSYSSLVGSDPLGDVDVFKIHEKLAMSLYFRSEFDSAVDHFILARTKAIHVLALFPELASGEVARLLSHYGQSQLSIVMGEQTHGQNRAVSGPLLHHAAAALVKFCSHHRPRVLRLAQRANRDTKISFDASADIVDESDKELMDPIEAVKTAETLDSMLLSALVHCVPIRRTEIIDLLSSTSLPCRAQLDSGAILLASQGNAFTEPLLWLYRMHGAHSRVLGALNEDSCVGEGTWSRQDFFIWTAEYLRWLWFNEGDVIDGAPQLVLSQTLRMVIAFDAGLGLRVLTDRGSKDKAPGVGANSLGGMGLTVQDVIAFLNSCTHFGHSLTSPFISKNENSSGSSSAASRVFIAASLGGAARHTQAGVPGDRKDVGPMGTAGVYIPLLDSYTLSAAYLEWVLGVNYQAETVSAVVFNDYARLLIDSIPISVISSWPDNSPEITLVLREGDSDAVVLFKVLRRKLQRFLKHSSRYDATMLLGHLEARVDAKKMPQEFALLFERLEQHDDALSVYVQALGDMAAAETYCDRVYSAATATSRAANEDWAIMQSQAAAAAISTVTAVATPSSSAFVPKDGAPNSRPYHDIYLRLCQTVLRPDVATNNIATLGEQSHEGESVLNTVSHSGFRLEDRVRDAITLAEKHYDRLSSHLFLSLLPHTTPVTDLARYLSLVFEAQGMRKRQLQIAQQLFRVKEVNVRTKDKESFAASAML